MGSCLTSIVVHRSRRVGTAENATSPSPLPLADVGSHNAQIACHLSVISSVVCNTAIKAYIRNRDFFKIPSALETGAEYGMWTLERYRAWMQKRTKWVTTMPADESPDAVIVEGDQGTPLPPLRSSPSSGAEPQQASRGQAGAAPQSGTIEIEPVEGGLEGLIKELEKPE